MSARVAVITGANKGLGLALTRALCRTWGDAGQVVMTARDPERGARAQAALEQEGLHPVLLPLDLADPASPRALADQVGQAFGRVDLLIQNGAYAALPDEPGRLQARPMIGTNNLGTHRVLRAFRPPAVPRGPGAGEWPAASARSAPWTRACTGASTRTAWTWTTWRPCCGTTVAAVEGDRAAGEGWPQWVNVPSKVGQVAAARIFSRELASEAPGVLVNAVCCPGWMITDASRPYLQSLPPEITPKAPDDAAGDVLWAGLLPSGTRAPRGELVQYRKVLPWI